MANIASFPIAVQITGDNVATSVVVGLGYTPTTATLVTAYDANYNSVAANVSSVVPGSSNVTINFVAAFSGTIQVLLALGNSTYANAPLQPVTGTLSAVTAITNPLPAGTNVIGHIISDAGSVTAATLNAETTKVIGVVRTSDGAGNLYTTNSTTPAAHFAQDENITSILGTAPTTAGFLDVKGADGNVFVRQATAANLNATVAIAAAQTLATVTTVSTVTAVTTVNASRTVGNAGATLDAAIGGAAPTNALWTSHAPSTASAAACTATFINATGAAVSLKASAGNLYGLVLTNNQGATVFIEFFNTASVPTLGTTVVVFCVELPSGGIMNIAPSAIALMNFTTGIGFGCTTAENGSTTGSVTGMIFFK